VRRRRQPDDGERGVRRAEARDRSAPVVLVAEGGSLGARDLFAPRDEARASAARGDQLVQVVDGSRGGGGFVGASHGGLAALPLVPDVLGGDAAASSRSVAGPPFRGSRRFGSGGPTGAEPRSAQQSPR